MAIIATLMALLIVVGLIATGLELDQRSRALRSGRTPQDLALTPSSLSDAEVTKLKRWAVDAAAALSGVVRDDEVLPAITSERRHELEALLRTYRDDVT